MSEETWERDINGKLLPNKGEVIITNPELEKEIDLQKKELEITTDEEKKKILSRVIELLQDELKEQTEKHDILFTPLLHCELASVQKGLSCDGTEVRDLHADICARHCNKPSNNYKIWRDMKNPNLKIAIANFIWESSKVKKKASQKLKEAMNLLSGLTLVTGRTD